MYRHSSNSSLTAVTASLISPIEAPSSPLLSSPANALFASRSRFATVLVWSQLASRADRMASLNTALWTFEPHSGVLSGSPVGLIPFEAMYLQSVRWLRSADPGVPPASARDSRMFRLNASVWPCKTSAHLPLLFSGRATGDVSQLPVIRVSSIGLSESSYNWCAWVPAGILRMMQKAEFAESNPSSIFSDRSEPLLMPKVRSPPQKWSNWVIKASRPNLVSPSVN